MRYTLELLPGNRWAVVDAETGRLLHVKATWDEAAVKVNTLNERNGYRLREGRGSR